MAIRMPTEELVSQPIDALRSEAKRLEQNLKVSPPSTSNASLDYLKNSLSRPSSLPQLNLVLICVFFFTVQSPTVQSCPTFRNLPLSFAKDSTNIGREKIH